MHRYNDDGCFANERMNDVIQNFLPPNHFQTLLDGIPSMCGFIPSLPNGRLAAAVATAMSAPPPPVSA